MVRIWIALIFGFVLCLFNPAHARTLTPGCLLENEFSTMTPSIDCVVASFQRNYFDCTHSPGPVIVIENRCDSEFLILLEPNEESADESSIEQFGHPVDVGESLTIETRLVGEAESWESGDYSWTYPMEMDGVDYELRIGFSLPPRETSVELGGCRQTSASSTVLWFLCLFGLFIRRPAFCDGSLTNEQG